MKRAVFFLPKLDIVKTNVFERRSGELIEFVNIVYHQQLIATDVRLDHAQEIIRAFNKCKQQERSEYHREYKVQQKKN